MSSQFEMLKEGLEDAIDYHKGAKELRKSRVSLPAPPKIYNAKEIKRLRAKLNLSQSQFAELLYVSVKTVQAWEIGSRNPQSSALRLLQIVDNKSEMFSFKSEMLATG